MTTTHLHRLTLAGALAFAAEGALELVHDQAPVLQTAADYAIEGSFALGLLLTLAGLLAIQLRQERDAGAAGQWGLRLAAGGQAAIGVCALATILRGADALGPVFGLGVLAWVAGGITLAVSIVRAGVLPRWTAAVLPLGQLAALALGGGGLLVLAAAWLAVAAGAMTERFELRPVVA